MLRHSSRSSATIFHFLWKKKREMQSSSSSEPEKEKLNDLDDGVIIITQVEDTLSQGILRSLFEELHLIFLLLD